MANPFRSRRGRVLLRVVLYSTALLVGLPLAFSQVMISTQRQPTDPVPAGYEELWFESQGLRLRGWLLPGSGQRVPVVLAHGLGDSLESYAPIGDRLSRRGHPVLLFDLRGHGASEGRHTTMGALEREDVRAALELIRRRDFAQPGVIVFGFSMGAVAALRAASDRDDVRAVVVESPYDTFRNTVAHHAWLLYRMPRWVPIIPLAIAAAEWRAGFDADEVDAVAAAARVRAPLLAIVDGGDPRMPEAVVRRVFDAHPGPKSLWVAPGAGHVGAVLHPDYWRKVFGFLDQHGL
jgi:pimeloyl-ACP methyl ester carboxylesterase